MAKKTIEVNPTQTTTEEAVQMETRTTFEQVETPVESNQEGFEMTGAVMVVNKRPGTAALFGAAAGGAAIGAGTFFVSTLANKKLTNNLIDYLQAYINNDNATLTKLRKKNEGLKSIDTMTLFDFVTEMDAMAEKAKIGWKNPFGATKKQIDTLQQLVGLAFAAKEKAIATSDEADNMTIIDKTHDEINEDNGDKA